MVKQDQIRLVKKTTERYTNFLKEHNLKPEETEKRRQILEDHNPYYKFKHHSVYLFDRAVTVAPWRFIGLRGGILIAVKDIL